MKKYSALVVFFSMFVSFVMGVILGLYIYEQNIINDCMTNKGEHYIISKRSYKLTCYVEVKRPIKWSKMYEER